MLVEFDSGLPGTVQNVLLANAITLTPGTVTMNMTEDGLYEVHALTVGAAEGLRGGDMQKMVAWLFGETYEFELLEGKD